MHNLVAMAILAAEESESGGVDLVLPDPVELYAGIVAFGIVFYFIWKWAWPTINKTLEQRQAAMVALMEEAEKAKGAAESLLADYQAQLAESKTEANRIIEEARATAEQIKADALGKAEASAEQILAKAREEAAADKARALSEARTEVGDISVDLAGKIIGESLVPSAHQDLIDRYLDELERL